MTLELEIDDLHMEMLERIEEQRDGDVRGDIDSAVESIIHDNYQQLKR